MLSYSDYLNKLIANEDLTYNEMDYFIRRVITNNVSDGVLSGFLVALRMKKESIDEIIAAVNVLKESSLLVPIDGNDFIDVVGTGGDGAKTFNISTATMFVLAAMGVKVVKHGGRAVSSKSGSVDLLETLGANLDLTPLEIIDCVNNTNIGFICAFKHNKVMGGVSKVRKELGIRTIFNLLGPLLNPSLPKKQLIGVCEDYLLPIYIKVLKKMGLERAIVVHGDDGLDEVSITGKTNVFELKNGIIKNYSIKPEDFGLKSYQNINDLCVSSSNDSLSKIKLVLEGSLGICRDIVVLNAGVAAYCADAFPSINEGVICAKEIIDKGIAKEKLNEFISYTNKFIK